MKVERMHDEWSNDDFMWISKTCVMQDLFFDEMIPFDRDQHPRQMHEATKLYIQGDRIFCCSPSNYEH